MQQDDKNNICTYKITYTYMPYVDVYACYTYIALISQYKIFMAALAWICT